MIDVHCHYLPNVDDGPSSWEESLEMAKIAVADGIQVAVTTPHWIRGTRWQSSPDMIRELVDELNSRLVDNRISLKVLSGMEVGITEHLPELVSEGKVLKLGNSDHLLVEIPFFSLPFGIEEIVFGLKSVGVTPILAHPERNRDFQREPEKMENLVEIGALVQVTAGSFSGFFGRSCKKCAMRFAELGALHLVASDAHSVKRRPPIISDGLKVLEEHIGKEKVDAIIDNSYEVVCLEPAGS